MPKIKQFFLPFAACIYFTNPTWGQALQNTIGSVSISSPTAASLGKFGDIPVNYFTGIPNIEIPFYTVESGPLKLPISLSYHASGLKVEEAPGWVGAGWALNAGGVITRTVQGQLDEAGTNSGSENDGHFTENGYNSYLYQSGVQDWQGFASGVKDGEPDLFFFNFGGYTGKFYFRDDGTPVTVPEQDLKIIPSYSGGRSIDYFTIITPDGNQYIFGNSPGVTGAAPIETTNPYSERNGPVGSPPVSSWYLNKIVSDDNQFSITLTYTAETYGCFTVSMFPIDPSNITPPGNLEYDLVKNLMQGVRLSMITFQNDTVRFVAGANRTDLCDNVGGFSDNANTSATTLGAIQISDGNGFCKKYKFYYGYFSGDNTPLPINLSGGFTITSDEQRLRLDSIQEISCDSTIKLPPYKFSYFSGQVPRRLSFGIDHWGFSNGVTNNAGLIPTVIVNGTTITGANRDAGSLATIEAGTLNQITYPTGGKSTLVFEANSVFTSTSYNTTVGLTDLVVNLYGQARFIDSGQFTSNGNTITAFLNNSTSNFTGTFKVINSVNAVVYTTTVGNNSTYSPTFTLAAGNYTAIISIPTNDAGGMQAILSQPTTIFVTGNAGLGGLRISSITNSDAVTSNDVVTTYNYNDPGGHSTGWVYSVPTYVQMIRNDIIANVGYWGVGGFHNYTIGQNGCPTSGSYYLSPSSIRPMATVQGNPFGYQTVTVSQSGNGYSVYNYYMTNGGFTPLTGDFVIRNISTGSCPLTIPNYPAAPLPFDSKRGELYYEQHYNSSGQILKDAYHYPIYNETPILSTPAFIVSSRYIGGANELLGTFYSLNTVRKTSLMTVEDDYQPGGGFVTKTTTEYYGSKFHNQETRSVTTTSTGDSLIRNTAYSFDFRIPTCDAISDCSTEYNNVCASCQSTYNTARQNCAQNDAVCLSTADTIFLRCNTNARTSYVSCRKTNYMNPTNSFKTCIVTAEGSADGNLKPILQLQDEARVVPIEGTEFKDANLLHADFTSYGYSTAPSGIPYPATTQLINLQASSTTFTNAAVSSSTISKDGRYLNEATYSFANGNPAIVTPYDGIANSYIWDYLNTKPIAKVTNTTVDQVAYTSFEADGKGGWTFSGTPSTDASAKTGTKDYTLNGSNDISKGGLSSTKTFIVSYWSKTGSASINGATAPLLFTKNGWSYYEHKLPGVSAVIVTGSVTIDELRLYPSDAQMSSYTYAPLTGMTTSDDVDSHITYYLYDALGRLNIQKDQDGNIIKTVQYHYTGQALP